jgi:hypothetical protein
MNEHDPSQDYSGDDVRRFVAEANGYTVDQIKALDFPDPDYRRDGAPYWHWETVYDWLGHFHTAMAVSERAHHPERFDDFARAVRAIMRKQA